jgi:hypothetical protein
LARGIAFTFIVMPALAAIAATATQIFSSLM